MEKNVISNGGESVLGKRKRACSRDDESDDVKKIDEIVPKVRKEAEYFFRRKRPFDQQYGASYFNLYWNEMKLHKKTKKERDAFFAKQFDDMKLKHFWDVWNAKTDMRRRSLDEMKARDEKFENTTSFVVIYRYKMYSCEVHTLLNGIPHKIEMMKHKKSDNNDDRTFFDDDDGSHVWVERPTTLDIPK